MKFSTTCSCIDNLLRGGIESGTITGIYGEGGSGKTNFCLQMVRNIAVDGKKVIYIDTEGVSIERLRQISGDKSDKVLENILMSRAYSFDEQEKYLKQAKNIALSEDKDVGLIVIDSFTIFYRVERKEENNQASARLGRQMVSLLNLARKKDIPVIITTQVYKSHSSNSDEPIGGHLLYHNAKTILKIEKVNSRQHIRKMSVIKHRSLPEMSSVMCKITDKGLISLE